jgi:hypothetical protein
VRKKKGMRIGSAVKVNKKMNVLNSGVNDLQKSQDSGLENSEIFEKRIASEKKEEEKISIKSSTEQLESIKKSLEPKGGSKLIKSNILRGSWIKL